MSYWPLILSMEGVYVLPHNTKKIYSKMDINIDEENIIASVMKEEKTLYYQ